MHPTLVGIAAPPGRAPGGRRPRRAREHCDGFARIQQQGGDPFTFDTLNAGKLSLTLRPKTLHDEMNATTFDAYGRMQANLGVEAVPASAAAQTTILYPFVNPSTRAARSALDRCASSSTWPRSSR